MDKKPRKHGRINDNGPPYTYSLRNEILRIRQHADKILRELDERLKEENLRRQRERFNQMSEE